MSLVISRKASMEVSTNPSFSIPIPKWGICKKPELPADSLSFLIYRISVPQKPFSGTTGTSISHNELHCQPHSSPSLEKSPAPPKNNNGQGKEQQQKKKEEVGGSTNVGEKLAENHLKRPRRRATYKVAMNMTELQQQREAQQQQKKKKDDYSAEKMVFSLSLSQREMEEDFVAMTGRKPSLRPKKRRAKTIQRQIEEIFPGGSLAGITPDSYKAK